MKKNVILTSLVVAMSLMFMACSNPAASSEPAGNKWQSYDPVLFPNEDVPEDVFPREIALSAGEWRYTEIDKMFSSCTTETYIDYTVTDIDITCTSRVEFNRMNLTESQIKAINALSKEEVLEAYSTYKPTDYYTDGNQLVLISETAEEDLADYNETSTTFSRVMCKVTTNATKTKYKADWSFGTSLDDTEYFMKK